MSGIEDAQVARCPKCGALVQDWQPYGTCKVCKEPFSAAFDAEMEARLGSKPVPGKPVPGKNCPVCSSGNVNATTETIDRNTGGKVGVGSLLGGLALLLVGGFLLVGGVSSWNDPSGSPVRLVGFGALMCLWGVPMVVTFVKRQRAELASYVCRSCQARWNRLGSDEDSAALDSIVEGLTNDDSTVRAEAAAVLANIKDDRTLDALISAAGDREERVRAAAVYALAGIGDGKGIEAILHALGDENKSVRVAAAGALGHYREPRIMGPLIAAMKDTSWTVRSEAIDALTKITGRKFALQEQAEEWWREHQHTFSR